MQKMMTNLNVRVDKSEKETAMKKLKGIGMDMSTAISLFIHQINSQNEFPLKLLFEREFAQSVYDDLDKAIMARENGSAVYTPAKTVHAKARQKYGVTDA